MCGIAGIYRFDNKSVDNSLLKQMSDILSHRGPDNFGIYKKHNYGVIHRLLKIQDLSKNSNQPIESERYIMSYNGEIYNYLELKKNLQDEGMVFISDGDTEVLLACFEKYGIKKTLEFIDGCYAIALYDKKKDQLNLIRDRMGIKPLYYYKNNNKLVFGSEIKAILQDKEIEHYYNIDTVLLSFLCKLWMPQKETLFKDIFMIEPGSIMVIDKKEVKFIKYYEHKYNIKEYLDSEDEIEKQFGEIFKNSIRKKLISKVSVAAFLSGGIDSSLICKEVVDYGKKNLNAYTVSYQYDENTDLKHAQILCEKEKIKHHNTQINPEDYSIDNIDKVLYSVEEFMTDKVYLSVYFNYKSAKEDGYTVILNGQGADETWLGYLNNWDIYKIGNNELNDAELQRNLILEYYMPKMIFGEKLKIKYRLMAEKALKRYLDVHFFHHRSDDLLNDYQIMSFKTILHDLLMQEDKLAMAHSIESRVPFVDEKDLVNLSYKISGKYKIKDGREKYILRKYGKGLLPDSIVERNKLPFQEPPRKYNENLDRLIYENQEKIQKCKLLNKIIDKKYLKNLNNFEAVEKWWILMCYRFEDVFNMEV